mgnify:FL=1
MRTRSKVLLGVGIALNLFVLTIAGASAANGGEALNGLREFFIFLGGLASTGITLILGLAGIGLQALVAFWGTL